MTAWAAPPMRTFSKLSRTPYSAGGVDEARGAAGLAAERAAADGTQSKPPSNWPRRNSVTTPRVSSSRWSAMVVIRKARSFSTLPKSSTCFGRMRGEGELGPRGGASWRSGFGWRDKHRSPGRAAGPGSASEVRGPVHLAPPGEPEDEVPKPRLVCMNAQLLEELGRSLVTKPAPGPALARQLLVGGLQQHRYAPSRLDPPD